jgi:hypothetical protein
MSKCAVPGTKSAHALWQQTSSVKVFFSAFKTAFAFLTLPLSLTRAVESTSASAGREITA